MVTKKRLFDENIPIIKKYFNKRLIDANDALERLQKAEKEMKVVSIAGCKAVPMYGVIEFIQTRPTVDAVEVVHGRWEDKKIRNGKPMIFAIVACADGISQKQSYGRRIHTGTTAPTAAQIWMVMGMLDCVGKELNIGDKVICADSRYADLLIGEVVKLTPQKAWVRYHRSEYGKQYTNEKLKESYQIFKYEEAVRCKDCFANGCCSVQIDLDMGDKGYCPKGRKEN